MEIDNGTLSKLVFPVACAVYSASAHGTAMAITSIMGGVRKWG